MACEESHVSDPRWSKLPDHQGGPGRHICCGCAYEKGYSQGLAQSPSPCAELSTLRESQANRGRHKSALAAFAMGYYNGVFEALK